MSKALVTTAMFAIAITASATFGTTSARADANAPFCATTYGMGGSAGTACNFYTLAQCQATISGVGGSCSSNPYLRESFAGTPRSR
jgi:Protein of unknown function (DUF3551)